MVLNGRFSQLNLILLMAFSGWFLTGSDCRALDVYSELGKSILLNIMNQNSSSYHDVKWFKGNSTVAKYKSGPKLYGDFLRRVNIFPNGSLRVNSVSMIDEGIYHVDVYKTDGTVQLTKEFKLHLFEKLSTPVMSVECTTEHNMFVSCEVRGAVPVSFYLNEQRLTKDNAVFSDQGRKATLRNVTSFPSNKTFFCKVENPISKSQSVPSQLSCTGLMASYFYIIFIVLGVIALIIFVRLLYCCVSQTHNCNMKKLRICEDYI
ncbi:T-cell surface antigen CD2-like [Rhinoraja longicauda]